VTLERLRQKRAEGSFVRWWNATGYIVRIARDGSWADMLWFEGDARWSKRQSLARLSDWAEA